MTMKNKKYKAGQIVTIKTKRGNMLFRIAPFATASIDACSNCPRLQQITNFCFYKLPASLYLKRIDA